MHDESFVKLYGSILNSSLWMECLEARLLFMGMLAAAGADGVVRIVSLRALAHKMNLTVEQTKTGLAVLEAPDPESRSQAHEGRRVLPVEGGWLVVNHRLYREFRSERQEADRLRKKAERAASGTQRTRPRTSADGADASGTSDVSAPDAEAEAEAEEDLPTHHSAGAGGDDSGGDEPRCGAPHREPLTVLGTPPAAELEDGEPEPDEADAVAAGELVWRRYRARVVEATGMPPGEAKSVRDAAGRLGAWLFGQVRTGLEAEALLGRLLAAFFADEWARGAGWPLAALANAPQKYLTTRKEGPRRPANGRDDRTQRPSATVDNNPHAGAPSVAEQVRRLKAGAGGAP